MEGGRDSSFRILDTVPIAVPFEARSRLQRVFSKEFVTAKAIYKNTARFPVYQRLLCFPADSSHFCATKDDKQIKNPSQLENCYRNEKVKKDGLSVTAGHEPVLLPGGSGSGAEVFCC